MRGVQGCAITTWRGISRGKSKKSFFLLCSNNPAKMDEGESAFGDLATGLWEATCLNLNAPFASRQAFTSHSQMPKSPPGASVRFLHFLSQPPVLRGSWLAQDICGAELRRVWPRKRLHNLRRAAGCFSNQKSYWGQASTWTAADAGWCTPGAVRLYSPSAAARQNVAKDFDIQDEKYKFTVNTGFRDSNLQSTCSYIKLRLYLRDVSMRTQKFFAWRRSWIPSPRKSPSKWAKGWQQILPTFS